MNRALDLAVDAVATYRITHLIVEDTIPFGKARSWIQDRSPNSLLAEWVTCPWCVSMWVGAGVVTARALLPGFWDRMGAVLAVSGVTGLLATWEQAK